VAKNVFKSGQKAQKSGQFYNFVIRRLPKSPKKWAESPKIFSKWAAISNTFSGTFYIGPVPEYNSFT